MKNAAIDLVFSLTGGKIWSLLPMIPNVTGWFVFWWDYTNPSAPFVDVAHLDWPP